MMSSSSLRALGAGLTLIVAVLTGLLAGWLGSPNSCTKVERPVVVTSIAPTPSPTGQQTVPGPGDFPPPGGQSPSPTPAASPPPAVTSTVVKVDESCEREVPSVAAAVIGFFGAGLAGLAVTALLFVRRREDLRPVSAAPARVVGDPQVAQDRAGLIQSMIYVRERVSSKALADRLDRALQEAGVVTITPGQEPFDPTKHEAGGSTPAAEASQVGMIASIEVPGYSDRGTVLRAPVVIVYVAPGK